MITLEERFEGVKDTLKTIPTINRSVFSRVSETRESETLLYSISLSFSFKDPRFQCPGTKRGVIAAKEEERGKENVRESP